MEEAELCPTGFMSHLREEESGDEELSVLPRHTKVVVTGNNRTKSVLLGLQGVVKKAVGLGGWHWLVLKNGIEVKLQRNALSVVEHPAGNDLEDDMDFDSSGGSEIGEKGHHSFSKSELLVNLKVNPLIQHSSSKLIGAKSTSSSIPINVQKPRVNLEKLGTNSLWRYCCHYHIVGINADSSREQMLNAVERHFESQPPLDELQVLADLAQALKRRKSKNSGPKERGIRAS